MSAEPRARGGADLPTPPGPTPPPPLGVLAAAIVLPGAGHVWLGQAQRAMVFLFFMVVLGWVSAKLAPAEASFVGRHAGGLFIYALSIMDAYKLARVRRVLFEHARDAPRDGPGTAQREREGQEKPPESL